VNRRAIVSPCGRYRYWLGRTWSAAKPLLFVMLNPSTADAEQDDPTIRRCIRFGEAMGFGGIEVVNLFAFRATQPKAMALAGFPVGPDNDEHIRAAAASAGAVCAAWGAVGTRNAAEARVQVVAPLIRAAGHELQCLQITRSGYPQHPLYLSSSCRLKPYTLPAIADAMEPA
jgi:hypothetical protein